MAQRSSGAMDPDSQPLNFYGEFRHALDEKNRLTIPARWRRKEGEEFVMFADPHGQCLLVMPPQEFARIGAAVESNPQVPPLERRGFLRQLHAKAQHAVPDKQGRLVVADDLCRQLGLKGEVALIGGRGRFEIWNLENWKRSQEAEASTYQHVANVIGL